MSATEAYVRARLERRWDAIVVGAGLGGLTAAALLARRAGLRVLVLERHYAIGGLTQTFHRRRHEFEVGVHYVAEVGERHHALRRVFDTLTEGRLRWAPFGPSFDEVRFDGEVVRLGGDPERQRAALLAFSPREEKAIDRYVADVKACVRGGPRLLHPRAMPRAVDDSRHPFRRFTDVTTAEHLAAIGCSDRLASLLTYCFGNYGCPPERSSFAAHATTVGYYFGGAAFPVGGGSRIGAELARATLDRGGRVVVRAEVDAIRSDGDKVCGVRLRDGRELDAPIVISDAGVAGTARLLAHDEESGRLAEVAHEVGPSLAHCGLYLGLDRDPKALGLAPGNLWCLDGPTTEMEAESVAWLRGERTSPPGFFATCAAAVDPSWSARRPGRTAIVASFPAPFAPFAAHKDEPRGRRAEPYETLKARLTREALRAVTDAMPHIASSIEHVELSTPASTYSFTGHAQGQISGLDHTPRRFALASTPRTRVRGLALAGQDAWFAGIGGAVFGGLTAASWITGRDFAREILWRGR